MAAESSGVISTAARVARGAAWSYGAQIVTVVGQFAYAAATSRLVSPHAFGDYSIALTAVGVLTLLASGGIAQSVGRLRELAPMEMTNLLVYALIAGTSFCALTVLSAPGLASIWGSVEATNVIRVLALNAMTAPLMGLFAGLARRRGDFRSLAIATVASNLLSMAAGVALVWSFRSAVTLVAAPVIAQALITLWAYWAHGRGIQWGRLRRGGESVTFSWRLTAVSLFQYVLGATPRFGVANALGAGAIGQWNRAEVLATLPFQQLQAALLPVVYPEFRHDRAGASRARRKWADMIALVAWVTIPAGVAGAVLLPHLLPILLGDQWQQAALFTIPLALAGGLQPPTVLLAAAIEAIGKFRVIWLVNAVVFASQLTAVALVFVWKSPWPAVCALLVMNSLSHALYASWGGRRGYLDIRALARSYRSLFLACVWLALALLSFEFLFLGSQWARFTASSVLAISAVTLWRGLSIHGLEWLPPYRMARRLGALRSQRPSA